MKINTIGQLVKTNPIQTQSNPIAERVKLMQSMYLQRIMKKNAAKGYEKTKPKQTQFAKRVKLMQNVYLQRIMKKIAAKGYEKTNPNKPNFKRDDGFSAYYKRDCQGPQLSCLPLRLSSLAPTVTRVQAQDEAAGESKTGASQ